ncbi:MAG: hypothetical protein RRY35_01390, partial [Clostridiales bacterium]
MEHLLIGLLAGSIILFLALLLFLRLNKDQPIVNLDHDEQLVLDSHDETLINLYRKAETAEEKAAIADFVRKNIAEDKTRSSLGTPPPPAAGKQKEEDQEPPVKRSLLNRILFKEIELDEDEEEEQPALSRKEQRAAAKELKKQAKAAAAEAAAAEAAAAEATTAEAAAEEAAAAEVAAAEAIPAETTANTATTVTAVAAQESIPIEIIDSQEEPSNEEETPLIDVAEISGLAQPNELYPPTAPAQTGTSPWTTENAPLYQGADSCESTENYTDLPQTPSIEELEQEIRTGVAQIHRISSLSTSTSTTAEPPLAVEELIAQYTYQPPTAKDLGVDLPFGIIESENEPINIKSPQNTANFTNSGAKYASADIHYDPTSGRSQETNNRNRWDKLAEELNETPKTSSDDIMDEILRKVEELEKR